MNAGHYYEQRVEDNNRLQGLWATRKRLGIGISGISQSSAPLHPSYRLTGLDGTHLLTCLLMLHWTHHEALWLLFLLFHRSIFTSCQISQCVSVTHSRCVSLSLSLSLAWLPEAAHFLQLNMLHVLCAKTNKIEIKK